MPPCWPPRRPNRPCSIPLQEAADGWQARLVDDGLDPALATVIRLACDGLWLCDLFGLASPQGNLRAQVGSAFEQMTLVDTNEEP